MGRAVMPEPRLKPLPVETDPGLKDAFQTYVKVLGFVPNSVLIMQRKPKLVRALSQLAAAVWEYRTSALFSEKERVALDFTLAAASQPNDVTDDLFATMRQHWSEDEIVEITGVIALFGFMNRWNDTMATPLEAEPTEVGEKHLAHGGWNAGKHQR